MANMATVKTPQAISHMGIAKLREEYDKLADSYTKLLDHVILICPKCGKPLSANNSFYQDVNYATTKFPICKACVSRMVEQREETGDPINETKQSVQKVLQLMDLPYIDSFYEDCMRELENNDGERYRHSPFATYITSIKALPTFRGMRWKDSTFGNSLEISEDVSTEEIEQARPDIKKAFGSGFSEEDYLFLQDQYDDWKARYQIDSKAQETYIQRICFKMLDIWKAQKAGKDTTKLDSSLDQLMNSMNLQPKQNSSNSISDALTFSQLIEKWEVEEPITEPDPEFKDVDGIGKKIRVWFAGYLGKALGLRLGSTLEYEEELAKYTVNKPSSEEEGNSRAIYNELFGRDGE